MIRAVVFDRDNTLLRFDMQAVEAIEASIQTCVPQLPPRAARELWRTWSGPWPRHEQDEPAFWHTFSMALGTRHQLPEARLMPLSRILATYYTCFRLFPDAPACVAALKAGGLRLGILTNFELPSVQRTLLHAGLDPAFFAATISSGTLRAWKPNPSAYQTIAAALDTPLSACAFVDDTAEHVAAARALGMRAFLLDRSRQTDDLDAAILCSLESLPQLLLAGATGS
jgi:2-haloalkanoic acid dehalogenase type II